MSKSTDQNAKIFTDNAESGKTILKRAPYVRTAWFVLTGSVFLSVSLCLGLVEQPSLTIVVITLAMNASDGRLSVTAKTLVSSAVSNLHNVHTGLVLKTAICWTRGAFCYLSEPKPT